MKLSRIASLLAGAGILAGAQVALASDGTITFQGEITANTCDIDVNGSGATNNTVTLPPISTDSLAAANAPAGRPPVRSEDGRVGKGGVSTCQSRWWPYH